MPLQLKDLTDEERLALVAVVQLVAEADSYVTEPEAKQLRSIISTLGEKAYQAASDAADERFADHDELKLFLKSIDRQEARELIYVTAMEVVLADSPAQPEREILDWLSRTWHVKLAATDTTPKDSR
jgi:hypothetical protein